MSLLSFAHSHGFSTKDKGQSPPQASQNSRSAFQPHCGRATPSSSAPWYLRAFAQAVPSARKALPLLYIALTPFIPHVDPQTGQAPLLIQSSLFPLGAVVSLTHLLI